jgi:O-methyltransferase involved in polyketide biosynthesis
MCFADGMDAGWLKPVEETAMLTAYARAIDSRRPRSILGDTLADEVVGKIDYDFTGLGVIRSVACDVALRAKMLDNRIRAFTTEHPDAVVVDLGAGLDTAVFRVDPPPTVDWYSVDLPAVIKLRDAMLPRRDRSHSVVKSVAEPDWVNEIPAHRPTVVVADGLFAFLSEAVIVAILRRITEHFRFGMVAFNDYGAVGRLNVLAGKVVPTRRRMVRMLATQWDFRGFKDAHHPEAWNPNLTLIEEASAMQEADLSLFPPLVRLRGRMAAHFPVIERKARILCYRF